VSSILPPVTDEWVRRYKRDGSDVSTRGYRGLQNAEVGTQEPNE
jgi:hypothetical protein